MNDDVSPIVKSASTTGNGLKFVQWKSRLGAPSGDDAASMGDGFGAEFAEEYEDLVKAGIVDPTKVVRIALQNAASVAGLMITTEAMIADKPEKKKDAPAMPHDHEDY